MGCRPLDTRPLLLRRVCVSSVQSRESISNFTGVPHDLQFFGCGPPFKLMASNLLGRRQSHRPLAFIGILHFKVATSWSILREVVNFEQTGVLTLPKFSAHGRGLAEGCFNSHASSGHGRREQWRTKYSL